MPERLPRPCFPTLALNGLVDMGKPWPKPTRLSGCSPTLNPRYDDEWTNPRCCAGSSKGRICPMWAWYFASATPECLENWQPLLSQPDSLSRPYPTFVGAGQGENTCTLCHAGQDAQGLAQIPAAQLSLSSELSLLCLKYCSPF